MTVASDIAEDYAHVDGIETVTHTQQPSGTETATAKAHREDLSFREVQLGGPIGLQSGDMIWVLWSSTIADDPTNQDTITDSQSIVWQILAITETAIGTTSIKWRCICRKQK